MLMIITPRTSHLFQHCWISSVIWLSRNKSVKKSRFSRMVKNSQEFSLLDLDLFSKKSESIMISLFTSRKRVKAFWFHFALLEKEWKHFFFTLHFSKKSESFLFSLFTSRTSKTHSRWSLLCLCRCLWQWQRSPTSSSSCSQLLGVLVLCGNGKANSPPQSLWKGH